jgi:hypothetical protein
LKKEGGGGEGKKKLFYGPVGGKAEEGYLFFSGEKTINPLE